MANGRPRRREEEDADEQGGAMDTDGDEGGTQAGGSWNPSQTRRKGERVFLPGDRVPAGVQLEADPSAYHMLHAIGMEWPCLSFDILRDALGDGRTAYPHTMYLAAGTQADAAHHNQLLLLKLSQLGSTKGREDDGSDESDSESDGDENEPVLDSRVVPHRGSVNRLRRAAALPENRHIVATWADTGRVHVYDVSAHVATMDGDSAGVRRSDEPLFTFAGHRTEGFALDWSAVRPGRLATGDCEKHIYLWDVSEAGAWAVDKVPYSGHDASVEDLQWSPVEANVFASCSADHSIRIWDARKKAGSALARPEAHGADVNVISWNRTCTYLLASGGDDGVFQIWDLRSFPGAAPAAQFKWHAGPIASIEWHPADESVLAVAGADDQVSLWDVSLERDSVEADEPDVPPQLLFIHQGQSDVKELHWHAQIDGLLATTAQTGMNVFRTISV